MTKPQEPKRLSLDGYDAELIWEEGYAPTEQQLDAMYKHNNLMLAEEALAYAEAEYKRGRQDLFDLITIDCVEMAGDELLLHTNKGIMTADLTKTFKEVCAEALALAADKMKYLKQFHAHNAKVLDNDKVYNRTAAFIYGDAEKAIRKLKEGK